MVERFVSERDTDGNHLVRTWWCFGDRELNAIIRSTKPVANGDAIIGRSVLDVPVPDAVRAVHESLRADYGRVDYAIVDGTPVVYDLNRTPETSEGAAAVYGAEIRALADGIDRF